MNSFTSLLAGFTFLALAVASAQTNAPVIAAALPPGVSELHDVVTGKGGGCDLHAEIAFPANSTGLLPAVLYIHGGGWAYGTHRDKKLPIVELAQHGYFAASIEYRLTKEAKWPAQIQDCLLAVRWLRANAAAYHVDPNRIGVWGDSAGGHLAACVATMSDIKDDQGGGGYPGVSSAVQAVVDYYGPVDFTDAASNPPATVQQHVMLFGGPYAQDPALWKSGSPLFFVKAGMAPTFIAHGDADVTVPLAQSIAFDKALGEAGVPHQFQVVKNAGHVFQPLPGRTIDPSLGDIKLAVYAFLDKYLKTP